MSTRSLKKLFEPRSVALVGASSRPGSLGCAVLHNLRTGGFNGALHLVNPRHQTIGVLPCVGRLGDIDGDIDVVVIAAPREAVIDIVEQAISKGVANVVVITSDPDHGPDGLKARLRTISRNSGIRIVGPNCLGVIAPRAGLNASFAADSATIGHIAVISQSGAVAVALLAWARKHNVGFSALVSLGDMADVSFSDLLDHFAFDPGTRAVLLYIEAIDDAQSFMSAARAAARVKPVIVIKSGRSTSAARAATTHTGALAGADAVYDAAFRRAGVLRVGDIDELFAAAETLSHIQTRTISGNRLAILTNGGGMGVMAVDRLDALGGQLAEVSSATKARLDGVLPTTWSHANPVDIVGDADADRFRAALTALLDDTVNDAIIVIHCPTALSKSDDVARAVADIYQAHCESGLLPKPVLAVWLGATDATNRILDAAHIPQYESNAVDGFMHLIRWRENREFLMVTPPTPADAFTPRLADARAVVARAIDRGASWLSPIEIADVLRAYQIPAASAQLARTPREAAEIARPVIATHGACVVKISSADIVHKSDVNGVALDLKTVEAVAAAMRDMIIHAVALRPDAKIDGVTIHPMIRKRHARELIAGLAEDPTFGPVVLFGNGGVGVEVLDDKALALPPLDLKLAHDLIDRTRVARMLRQYRDVPAANIDALADILVKLAQLSADIPEIIGLDLNPLLADAEGAVALDARIALRPCTREAVFGANPRFAIAPYPKSLEAHISLPDGTQLFLRPVRPEDEEAYKRSFQKVTQADMRLRLFMTVKELSHAFLAQLTQIDYARAYVLCAFEELTGELVGVVRLMRDASGTGGEYAILVRSDWKRRGLGWALMQQMIDQARRWNLNDIFGQVLAENTTMLSMCGELGFVVTDDPSDVSIKLAKLKLTHS